ncbi:hypothetical protein B0H13DRAFT_1920078 [Mycena leptocephala]|nr:hypothetical protein B0H13DRAFT_1920078 [Mycena leptocephala]
MFYNAIAVHGPTDSCKALEFNMTAIKLAGEAVDTVQHLDALDTRCDIAIAVGDYPSILESVRAAEKVTQRTGSVAERCRWKIIEATAHGMLGNLPHALNLCAQARALMSSAGLEGSNLQLTILDSEASLHFAKSEYRQARRAHSEILSMTALNRSASYHVNSLITIAQIDNIIGAESATVLQSLENARAGYIALGRSPLLCELVTAEFHLAHGDAVLARGLFMQWLGRYQAYIPDVVSVCLSTVGDPTHDMHNVEDKFRWSVIYLAFVCKIKDLAGQDWDGAQNLFVSALGGATQIDIHRLRGECMVRLGDLSIRRGDTETAREMWGTARPLFVASSQTKEVAAVDLRLTRQFF